MVMIEACLLATKLFDFMLVELRYYAQVAFGDPDRSLFRSNRGDI